MQSFSPGGHQILGNQTSREGPTCFQATQASSGQPIAPEFANASDQEIDRAVALAAEAHENWRGAAPATRANFLRELAGELDRQQAELIARAHLETGLNEPRLRGELQRACGQLRLFADVVEEGSWLDARLDRGNPQRAGLPQPELRRMLVPVGPVGVFGACNFPFAISVVGNDAVAAWAVGCPVVVKAHPGHPGTCELQGSCVQRVIERLSLPAGIFSLLQGAENRVGERLVQHPAIQAIGFTGSLGGGRALWQLAQARPVPIPFFAELGSLNPVFVFPSALESASAQLAHGLTQSIAFSHGQMCTRPGFVLYVESPAAQSWREQLVQAASAIPRAPMLTPGVSSAFESSVRSLLDQQGARVICPPPPSPLTLGADPPVVILEVDESQAGLPESIWQESFGPLTVLVRCQTLDSMCRLGEQLPGGLTATVHAGPSPEKLAVDWTQRLCGRYGRLIWNGFPTGVEVGHATHHGGPYPASFDGQGTSIGTASMVRFTRPVCFQNFPEALLPEELRRENPRGIWRRLDGVLTRDALK